MTDRERNTTKYLIGKLNELRDKGLMEDGPDRLTPKGIADYDQLVASGFRPSEEDAIGCLTALCGDADTARDVWELINSIN